MAPFDKIAVINVKKIINWIKVRKFFRYIFIAFGWYWILLVKMTSDDGWTKTPFESNPYKSVTGPDTLIVLVLLLWGKTFGVMFWICVATCGCSLLASVFMEVDECAVVIVTMVLFSGVELMVFVDFVCKFLTKFSSLKKSKILLVCVKVGFSQ